MKCVWWCLNGVMCSGSGVSEVCIPDGLMLPVEADSISGLGVPPVLA